MKKTIVIEVLLLFVLAVTIASAIEFFVVYNDTVDGVRHHVDGTYFWIKYNVQNVSVLIAYGCLSIIAAISTLAAMIVIAIKGLPCIKPLADKLHVQHVARKEARDQAKAEQAAIAKQERIAKLEAELDELKKDE